MYKQITLQEWAENPEVELYYRESEVKHSKIAITTTVSILLNFFNSGKVYRKSEWHDSLKERKILCWIGDIWDGDDELKIKGSIALICDAFKHDELTKFIDTFGCEHTKAIPLTDEELDNFKIGYKGE